MWTDISVGGLYGALKRLHSEGLIADIRTEQSGNFPTRQVYGITESGVAALGTLRHRGLVDFTLRPDPFDLALTRLGPDTLEQLPDIIATRTALLDELLRAAVEANARARPHLSKAETFALEHREARLRAEIDWHRTLVDALPDIVSDEATRTHDALPQDHSTDESKDAHSS